MLSPSLEINKFRPAGSSPALEINLRSNNKTSLENRTNYGNDNDDLVGSTIWQKPIVESPGGSGDFNEGIRPTTGWNAGAGIGGPADGSSPGLKPDSSGAKKVTGTILLDPPPREPPNKPGDDDRGGDEWEDSRKSVDYREVPHGSIAQFEALAKNFTLWVRVLGMKEEEEPEGGQGSSSAELPISRNDTFSRNGTFSADGSTDLEEVVNGSVRTPARSNEFTNDTQTSLQSASSGISGTSGASSSNTRQMSPNVWSGRRVIFTKYICLEASDANDFTGTMQRQSFSLRRWVREVDAIAFMKKLEEEQFNFSDSKRSGVATLDRSSAVSKTSDKSNQSNNCNTPGDKPNIIDESEDDNPFFGGGVSMM